MLFPNNVRELRDRGLLYYHVGRLTEARQDLENYLNQHPTAEDAPQILQVLRQMKNWQEN